PARCGSVHHDPARPARCDQPAIRSAPGRGARCCGRPIAHGCSVMDSRSKILVVDDAGPVVILCVNVLQALGYSIRAANRGEATGLGFNYILLKPFTPSELRGAVDKVLAGKS